MPDIAHNIKSLLSRIHSVARASGRNAGEVTLLAVSKTQTSAAIRLAYNAGQSCFGENYLQEALDKMASLSDLDIQWHFIGPIQSNKTRPIASHFQWVHTLDREKIARRLNDHRPDDLPPLNVCLQVNIDDEPSKSGISPVDLPDLAVQVASLPNLRLRGLMAIPQATGDIEKQRAAFFRLRQLLDNLRTLLPDVGELDTLSMGMTGDMDAAIAEGATIVRVGTGIFGARP
jgi:PLP dependent protein